MVRPLRRRVPEQRDDSGDVPAMLVDDALDDACLSRRAEGPLGIESQRSAAVALDAD